ncbi:MAG: transporter suffix domain-containing protein [Deltaproteobacteria bacterium]|nr:transporter suffix domain-containing protein [Deltaproteobacteria bacterium]
MTTKKNWKYYLGLSLFFYSFIPLCTVELVFFLPFLSFTKTQATTFAAVYLGTGEIAFLAAVALLGKPFIQSIKAKVKGFFVKDKAAGPPKPISRRRHQFGVFLFFFSFLPYLVTLGILLMGHPQGRELRTLVAILLSGDAIFVISLFVLGEEFWARLKKLFEWPGREVSQGNDG